MEMKKMNLYIIRNVLYDYTSGMVVIAACSLERCRELFKEEFCCHVTDYDDAIKNDSYSVYQVVDEEEGVKDYVYGGG
jgi:hypothetical protein